MSGTRHRNETAYHTHTNGLSNWLDKMPTDKLPMYVDVEPRSWNGAPPYVTFAYNTALQETARLTAFRLLYGGEVVAMLDAMPLPDAADASVAGA